jgi:histidyl-tRNA synthetase
MKKPSIPQGTRDFGPDVVRKRQYLLNTIRSVFELYGFQPLETPAMENLETLMGKYGQEGDKLIFRILNNGLDHPDKKEKTKSEFENILSGKNSTAITERALKYDLTIPFARYVAMNHGSLQLPFRRYQVQPVWRADRPQRGRYREFYQCDADVVGSNSLLNEVEFVNIYTEVFQRLGLQQATIQLNHRKILSALAHSCGKPDQMMDITIAIDKLDKIGLEKVIAELTERGLDSEATARVASYLSIEGSNAEKLATLRNLFSDSEEGKKGIADLEFILSMQQRSNVAIDLTLARGLNYYTGVIFEARAPKEVKIGSIGGGGRYDDLTGLFGVPGIPGVGISFGIDRIYDVLEELQLFPSDAIVGTKVLFLNMGEKEAAEAFRLLTDVRKKEIPSEIFPENVKVDKQFKYAEKRNIPYVVIIGSREMDNQQAVVKNIVTGEQETIAFAQLAERLSALK